VSITAAIRASPFFGHSLDAALRRRCLDVVDFQMLNAKQHGMKSKWVMMAGVYNDIVALYKNIFRSVSRLVADHGDYLNF